MDPTSTHALKRLIDNHLRSTDVYSQIRHFISEFAAEQGGEDAGAAL